MENILSIITSILTVKTLLLILGGTAFGILIGAIPGLTVNLAVAVMIPVTFYLSPVEAMAFLISIYKSGTFGGSISAILIGTPGTPAAAATAIDGYALTKKGRAGEALSMALYASVFADVISNVVLIALASKVAGIALKFGPAEYTLLVLFSLIIISGVSSKTPVQGLLATFIGLALSIIGMDPVNGSARFTFGSMNLLGGISFIPMLIGLFAVSEVFQEYSHYIKDNYQKLIEGVGNQKRISIKEFFSHIKTLIKSSLIGVFIGALPGSGSAIAAFLSYSEAKRASKKPEEFGEGSLDGIAASESGNNGVCGATLIPLLTLGIPGDAVTAIMFGALMMQGIVPGPLVFKNQGNVITGIYITLFIASIFMLVLGSIFNRYSVKILNIKKNILFPIVFVLCFAGTYATRGSMFDVAIMLIFGVVGYLLKKFNIQVAPIIIAFIIGPMLESSTRQALILSDGSMKIFFSSTISILFAVLILASIAFFIRSTFKNKKTENGR